MPILKSKSAKLKLFLIPVFVLAVAIGAQAVYNYDLNIQFTFQTLSMGVLFCYMPKAHRLISVLIYLALGIAGLPIFSNGNNGWEYFSSPAIGFFLGFIGASFIPTPDYKRWDNVFGYFVYLHLLIVGIGLFVIGYYTQSWSDILDRLIKYTPGMAVKTILGGLIVMGIERLQLALNRGNAG
jgi:biotin transport system substrate-specific component